MGEEEYFVLIKVAVGNNFLRG